MKRLKARVIAEQDYWLSFAGLTANEDERWEFYRFDSQGGEVPTDNPIYYGKVMHGITGAVLKDAYRDTASAGWVGGVYLYADYAQKSHGIRSLREWFGDAAVERWEQAARELP